MIKPLRRTIINILFGVVDIMRIDIFIRKTKNGVYGFFIHIYTLSVR